MTGLIYVAIIALWAAVLIPIWLRRHEADEVRAVDRFDGAMRALGRFRRSARVSDDAEVSVKGSRRADAATSRAAARRRTIMISLGVILVLSLVAWGLGRIPMWVPLLVLALLGGFVYLARRQVVASSGRASRTRAQATRQASRTQTAKRRGPARPQRREVDDDDVDGDGTPQPPQRRRREERVYEDIEAEYIAQRTEELARPRRRDPLRPTGSWEAQPQTLPTYVDAPAATSVPRGLDRATGTWDSRAMLDQVRVQRSRDAQDFFDQTVDYEERRAAGA